MHRSAPATSISSIKTTRAHYHPSVVDPVGVAVAVIAVAVAVIVAVAITVPAAVAIAIAAAVNVAVVVAIPVAIDVDVAVTVVVATEKVRLWHIGVKTASLVQSFFVHCKGTIQYLDHSRKC